MDKIVNEIAREARKLGACSKGYSELLSASDKRDLCLLYIKHLDFCTENDFPQKEFIKKVFGECMNQYGIFVDDEIIIDNKRMIIALGNTKGKINIDNYGVSEVHARHKSELDILANGNAFVMVDVYDDAVVNVCACDRAKVCVNRHGGKVTHATTEDAVVKIREMSDK